MARETRWRWIRASVVKCCSKLIRNACIAKSPPYSSYQARKSGTCVPSNYDESCLLGILCTPYAYHSSKHVENFIDVAIPTPNVQHDASQQASLLVLRSMVLLFCRRRCWYVNSYTYKELYAAFSFYIEPHQPIR